MVTQKLHENWRMRQLGQGDWLPAVVPGTVYGDLLANGRIEDPYYRDNENRVLPLMDFDYEYETEFDVKPELLKRTDVVLRLEGVDTIADIELNGHKLAHVYNMHRTWEFSVKDLLQETGNTMRVVFHSPTKYIKEEYEKRRADGSDDSMRGFPAIRKAHCMFGWDWGIRLPDAGLWRAVTLFGMEENGIESVLIRQEHEDDSVTLHLEIALRKPGNLSPAGDLAETEELGGLRYRVTVTDPNGRSTEYSGSPGKIKVENPELWWPHGYGAQKLYRIRVELMNGESVIDIWERRIGLRTMTMAVEKDEWGESFAHSVNGVKIFAMGADYIPEDSLLGRMNTERTRQLLKDCVDANFNCIRVWGGGHYPSDEFYDLCDEMGLVVWQDFMFACAVYNLTKEFEENIQREIIDNIKRLRHHASLGLWCGNNEMEMFTAQGQWVSSPVQKSDYVKMYEYIFPRLVKQYSPDTFYWPASPSSGGAFDDPNGENRGDAHYWGVWHGNEPFTNYRLHFYRYLSEFGFQSFPAVKTIETFTTADDRNIFSYVMEKHQRNNAANGKIMNYLSATFLYPNSFDLLVYASQLLQMEAIRYGVEHFRRNRGRCMGTIYWQLNDCWPVASWASIDYYGRLKALHYAAKRFFAPIMVSCMEEGLLSQDSNVNAEPYEVRKSIQLNVSNETRDGVEVLVRWALRNAKADIIKQEEHSVTVPALSSVWLPKTELSQAGLYEDYVSYEAVLGDEVISGGTVLFAPPKHYHFLDPELTWHVEGSEIVVRAETFAKSVEINNGAEDLRLSDNYFDMNAGEKRVRILAGKPEGIRVRSVFDIR